MNPIDFDKLYKEIQKIAKEMDETLYTIRVEWEDGRWRDLPVILCAAEVIIRKHDKDYPGGTYFVPKELEFIMSSFPNIKFSF